MASSSNSITILGSGTSTGLPVIGCPCRVCRSKNPRNHRLRASIWIQINGKSLLIDTSPDLRQQALKHKISRIDAVLFTHPHADHIHGIDELRCYNFLQRAPIPVFGNAWTCRELPIKFAYIFHAGLVEGGGVPQIQLNEFNTASPTFEAAGITVVPISLQHGSKECVGYRVGNCGYVTDCSLIPAASLDRLRGLDVLILDCVRLAPHRTHFNLEQALATAADLKPKRTYLTHLGHDFDHALWSKKLPRGIALAYDGLRLKMRSDE